MIKKIRKPRLLLERTTHIRVFVSDKKIIDKMMRNKRLKNHSNVIRMLIRRKKK